MSFPRYPAHKQTGVEWLGSIPAHWGVSAVGHRYEVLLGKMLDEKRITGAHLAPYLRNIDVQWNYINVNDLPEMDFSEGDLSRYRLAPGDLLVCEGGEVGRAAIWDGAIAECYYQKALHRLRPIQSGRDYPRYLYYVLRATSASGVLGLLVGASTIAHLTAEAFRRFRHPRPPHNEQIVIATFLDRETSKIDALIAEQERLIGLLQEKRQAAISRAVTKGLNPNAPMKFSGVEWLGDVPAHWKVKAFQRCVFVAEGQVDPEQPEYSGLALVAPNHVESGTGHLLALESALDQGAESGKYFCSAGDVIYSKIRPALRKACIAPSDCLCSADMYPLRAHSGLTNSFLLWFLLSEQFSTYAVLESQRVAMPKINRDSLKEIRVPIPPVEEQNEIVDFLDRTATQLDALSTEAARAVMILEERRSALISAAVTGQIDVRGLVEHEAA